MRSIALAFFLTFLYFDGLSQTPVLPQEGVEITKAIPPSPDAAALGKYGNIPVSTYTGVPNISIPFFTLKSGGITLPISLSYHSGGNKVEEMASSVGLGWTLNAGGAITRSIRGMADEEAWGFLDTSHYLPKIESTINGGNALSNYLLNLDMTYIATGVMDGEADIYNYNFGGYSGQFVMDNYGNVYTLPQQNIKFTFTINPVGPYIKSFTALTPDGIKYFFGSSNDGNDAIEKTYTQSSCGNPKDKRYYATSWFLKRIQDPMGHAMTFQYTTENYVINQVRSESKYTFQSIDQTITGSTFVVPTPPDQSCGITNTLQGVKLSSINFENGTMMVYANTNRLDLINTKAIDSVALVSNGLNKTYKLYYQNSSTTRLRLDSIKAVLGAPYSQNNQERYSFNYSPDSWTPNSVYSQDYWGFNNGHTENNTLVPWVYFNFQSQSGNIIPTYLPGAERSSNEQSMLGGMLTQINYPTGGSTTFLYEANRSYNAPVNGSGTNANYSKVSMGIEVSSDPSNPTFNQTPTGSFKIGLKKVFSINNVTGITLVSNGLQDGVTLNDNITASLVGVDSTGSTISTTSFNNNTTTVNVPNGLYYIQVNDSKHQGYTTTNPTGVKYTASANWGNDDATLVSEVSSNSYIVGGLRIKQIADFDGIHSTPSNIKTYSYRLPDNSGSSGWIDFQPVYMYSEGIEQQVLPGSLCSPFYQSHFLVRTGVSNYPLATSHGSVVGYSHVEEDEIGPSGPNGKTEYYYTNSQSNPDDGFGTGFPFAPPMNRDAHRGLLLRKVVSALGANNLYYKVQEQVNNYALGQQPLFVNCFKVGFDIKPALLDLSAPYYSLNDQLFACNGGAMKAIPYTIGTDFNYLSSDTSRTYSSDGSGTFVQQVNHYAYDPATYQVNQITSTNSKGEIIVKTVKYPNNYSNNYFAPAPSYQGILSLQSRGIVNVPIEEVIQKQNLDGSNARVIGATFTTYKPFWPLRDSVYTWSSNQPVNLTNFKTSYSDGLFLQKDARYEPRISFDKYDNAGNVIQERKVHGPATTYIWGYNASNNSSLFTYPIAEIQNADSSNIAYTHFESYNANVGGSGVGGLGNWTYLQSGVVSDITAPMGSLCYNLTGNTVSKSGLKTTQAYILSIWQKSGGSLIINGTALTPIATGKVKNGWVCYVYQISGVSSLSLTGTGYIDELRLMPYGSEMSTYTYIPLVGISAKCDAKNEITYFSYDGVGRLMNIKDLDGNIVKAYTYNYSNKPIPVYSVKDYSISTSGSTGTSNGSCPGEGYKNINGVCTYGIQSTPITVLNNGIYICTYHYTWPDGSVSQNYTTLGFAPCGS